jgi:hypothetical protein
MFTLTASSSKKMHVSYNIIASDDTYGKPWPADKYKGPIVDAFTGKVYDNQTYCKDSVSADPDIRCREYATSTAGTSPAANPGASSANLQRIPYIKNALSISAKYSNDVELEASTTDSNRNTTVAWMSPNNDNEIELTITEDRTGEFFHARKLKTTNSNSCPTFSDMAGPPMDVTNLEQPLYPSDFNSFTDCCDFTLLSQGDSVKRLLKNDLHCNNSNFADGISGDYPYEESSITLCVTHASGDYDTVVNPVCDIWRGYSDIDPNNMNSEDRYEEREHSDIQCRIGYPVKFSQSDKPTNIYGMNFNIPIQTANNGDKSTIKVVACAYQSIFPDVQTDSDRRLTDLYGPQVRMVQSPMLTLTYGARVVENACKNSDITKCQDAACLQKGIANVQQDASKQITSNDCTSFRTVTETDNPNFPSCERDSDCPSKSCKLTTYTEFLPYNESIVNETLINSLSEVNCSYNATSKVTTAFWDRPTLYINMTNVQVANTSCLNCDSNNQTYYFENQTNVATKNVLTQVRCPGGGVCKDGSGSKLTTTGDGTCQLPDRPKKDNQERMQCETIAVATLQSKLARLHQPQCTKPRLLSLAVVDVDVTKNDGLPMWPKFQPDYFGPYYVSAGTLQNFTIYGRANFKTVNVTFNLNGEIKSIPIGDRSPAAIIFAPGEFEKHSN